MLHGCGASQYRVPCAGAGAADELSDGPAYAARHRVAQALRLSDLFKGEESPCSLWIHVFSRIAFWSGTLH